MCVCVYKLPLKSKRLSQYPTLFSMQLSPHATQISRIPHHIWRQTFLSYLRCRVCPQAGRKPPHTGTGGQTRVLLSTILFPASVKWSPDLVTTDGSCSWGHLRPLFSEKVRGGKGQCMDFHGKAPVKDSSYSSPEVTGESDRSQGEIWCLPLRKY